MVLDKQLNWEVYPSASACSAQNPGGSCSSLTARTHVLEGPYILLHIMKRQLNTDD